MRICIIVEGAYPYVTGGVSSWLQQIMTSMPDVEFVIQAISAVREEGRKFRYEMPPNVVQVQEIFLLDEEQKSLFAKKKIKLSKREYDAFSSLMFGREVNWDEIFNFFCKKNVFVNSILSSHDFFKMAASYHEANFAGIAFTDFLWSLRSMYMPLFTILNANPMKADIYHSLSAGYAAMLAVKQKMLYNKPYFLTEHGIYSREREEEIIRADWVSGLYKDLWIDQFNKLAHCGYDYADAVSSLFEGARQFQIELGCDEKLAKVIPNGVDIKSFENILQKGQNDKYINLGAISRVARIKDLKTMIIAYSYAKEKEPRLKLWIMGPSDEDAQYMQECEKLIDRLQVRDIVFTGDVDVKNYIGKMDMLLLSSISEGQPLAILEAFAAKKPFIATNVGNCKGLIEGEFDKEGAAGFIVPVTDSAQMATCILKLSRDEGERVKMGEVGYRRVCNFYDKNDIYQCYRTVYEQLNKSGSC